MPSPIAPIVVSLAQLLVGPPGSGAAFADIQPAIDAAAPGDTILVLPGTYSPFDVDRALTIVGSGPGVTEVRNDAPAGGSGVLGVVARVHDVGAGGRVSISGLSFGAPTLSGVIAPLVSIRDCAAAVQLHDVAIGWTPNHGSTFFFGGWQLEIAAAAFVQLDEVLLDAPGGAGGDAIHVSDSTLWLSNAYVSAGMTAARRALVADGSDVLVVASSLFGADTDQGTVGSCFPGFIDWVCGNGGAGLVADGGSTVRVHGFPSDVIDGGVQLGSGTPCDCGGEPGPALFVGAGSSATVFGGPTFAAAVEVEPGATLAQSPQRAAGLSLAPVAGPLGTPLTATVATEPSAPVFLYGSFPATALVPVAGFAPGAALPLASIVPLGSGLADVGGTFSLPLALPASPLLAGSVVATQAVVAGALPGTSNASLARIGF